MKHNELSNKTYFAKDRVAALVDGIFAFAMTLLVINIDVPSVPAKDLPGAIYADWQNFTSYILCFFLLGIFWILHQKLFSLITKVNQTFIWQNIYMMIFVVFIPFSSQLVGDYGDTLFAMMVFNINLFLVGIFNSLLWYSAFKNKLVNDEFQTKGFNHMRSFVMPIVSVIAMVVAIFTPSYSGLTYLTIPLLIKIFNKNRD